MKQTQKRRKRVTFNYFVHRIELRLQDSINTFHRVIICSKIYEICKENFNGRYFSQMFPPLFISLTNANTHSLSFSLHSPSLTHNHSQANKHSLCFFNTHTHTNTHTHKHTHAHTHTHTQTHTHMHTHTHTKTHTHTHTHTHTLVHHKLYELA